MRIVSDLHIHSRYSRACSKDISIDNLGKYARMKGINLLGTGDFTHPEWIKELKRKLEEDEHGILWAKSTKSSSSNSKQSSDPFQFIWQTEISLMYKENGRGRRVHFVILAPNGEVAAQITDFLKKKGRVDYDGRPIFGFSAKELVDSLIKGISPKIIIIPAHIWTPYFGILGSKSGFDSIKECFGETDKHIYAIETGMSSDPAMNWRLSSLDKYAILSFSDMHSFWPWRIGREATIFDLKEFTYDSIFKAIKNHKENNTRNNRIESTIETDPGYGKYHYDGHSECNISFTPKESIKRKNICPVCKKPLTIGVLHRADELADRPEGYIDAKRPGFSSLIPLSEVISGVMKKPVAGNKTWEEYNKLVASFGDELKVLMKIEEKDISAVAGKEIARAIMQNRQHKIRILPGFDGEYGKPLFSEYPAEDIEEKRMNDSKKREKTKNR